MTLRTFHAVGTAANIAANASIVAKNSARLEFEELRTVEPGYDIQIDSCVEIW